MSNPLGSASTINLQLPAKKPQILMAKAIKGTVGVALFLITAAWHSHSEQPKAISSSSQESPHALEKPTAVLIASIEPVDVTVEIAPVLKRRAADITIQKLGAPNDLDNTQRKTLESFGRYPQLVILGPNSAPIDRILIPESGGAFVDSWLDSQIGKWNELKVLQKRLNASADSKEKLLILDQYLMLLVPEFRYFYHRQMMEEIIRLDGANGGLAKKYTDFIQNEGPTLEASRTTDEIINRLSLLNGNGSLEALLKDIDLYIAEKQLVGRNRQVALMQKFRLLAGNRQTDDALKVLEEARLADPTSKLAGNIPKLKSRLETAKSRPFAK